MAVPTDPVPLPARPSTADIDAIASRTFPSSFRGWDPDAVRVHLVQVAETVRAMAQRQSELERRLVEAEAAARRADITELDADEVATVLGEETARVLRTARESAAEIRAKAEERVSLLTRQAADDAAATRESATVDAENLRKAAHEYAAASRSAGDAYVEEMRGNAETELAAARAAVDEELGALRQAARDDAAEVGAQADDAAAKIRADADADAASVRAAAAEDVAVIRADADAYAAQVRSEADAVLESRIAEAERAAIEVRDVAQRDAEALRVAAQTEHDRTMAESTERVAEAERVRERVLADLARKRKSARQHLEQLRAGRDRLLEAYDVVRATTENATRELGTVLPDAKRAANDAARRVAREPDQTVEDLEVELAMARDANLPIMAPADPAEADVDAESDDLIVDLIDGEAASDDAEDEDAVIDLGGSAPSAAPPEREDAATATPNSGPESADPSASDHPPEATSEVTEAPAAKADAPPEAGAALPPRKPSRRHRHDDPLDGAALPEAPLEPLEAGEDFEAVRVIDTGEVDVVEIGEEPEVAIAAPTADLAASAATGVRVIGDVQPVPKPASGAEAALAAVARTTDPTPTSDTAEAQATPGIAAADADAASPDTSKSAGEAARSGKAEAGSDKATKPGAPVVGEKAVADPASTATSGGASDIDGLFDRLRRERGETTSAADTASDDEASGEPKGAAKKSVTDAAQATKASKKSSSGPTSTPAVSSVAKDADVVADPSGTEGTSEPDTNDSASAKDDVDASPTDADAPDARIATLFERRDAAVDEVARRLAKRLKRVLSDEQSELLDVLRRSKKQPSAAELLPAPDVHEAGFVAAAEADLSGAAIAGVLFAGDVHDSASDSAAVSVDDIAGALTRGITAPLRARLERALGDAAGEDEGSAVVDELELADRIRSCYREWRGDRLGDLVNDACATAFSAGMRAALPDDVGLEWHVDRGDKPCADCDDNVLAGVVAKGTEFPTGQLMPPAHPGCRCLALPQTP